MQSLFHYKSYKQFIQDIIESMGRGAVGRLAEAAGCNRTYLSQCLSSKVQLTPDHILGISECIGLTEEEQDYLLLLLLHDRSVRKESQGKFKAKITKLSQANLVLSKKINDSKDSYEISDSQKTKYYSSWKYSAVHTYTSIKDYQTTPAIAKRLRLTDSETHTLLKELSDMGLIFQSGSRWIHSGKNIHTPVGSAHTTLNHLNWRLKSIDDSNSKHSVHYTTVFAIQKSDWETLRQDLLTFIEKQRDQIHKSGSEEVYSFCCDLFQPFD